MASPPFTRPATAPTSGPREPFPGSTRRSVPGSRFTARPAASTPARTGCARTAARCPRRYAELSLGRGSECGDPADIEEQLDVESSYAMAPGVSQLVVGGDSCNTGDFGLQGIFDAVLAVLGDGSHPLASEESNSW